MTYLDAYGTPTLHRRTRSVSIFRRVAHHVPLIRLVQAIIVLFCAKLMLYYDLGSAAYGERIELLQNGTMLEQAASYLLWIDPISRTAINAIHFGF